MTNLTVFNSNGIELVISENGEAFATQAGYNRMTGVSKQTISKRLKGVNQDEIKTAEIQTAGGLQGVNLIPAKLIFKWAMTDSPELSEKMGEAGATVYLHQLAGYKVTSNSESETINQLQLPPADVRVAQLTQSLGALGIDLSNPRWNQALQDITLNILGINPEQRLLPQPERWLGVVEIAECLGFSQACHLSHRSKLGRFVSSQSHKLNRRRELRLVNGTQRECWVYQDCEQLRELVRQYFQ